MKRSIAKKTIILYVLDMLEKGSSKEKSITITNMTRVLNSMGIPCERRTIGRNVDYLIEYGKPIVKIRGGGCYWDKQKIKYIYDIKKLTSKETRYCNELFLDRIDTFVGFSSLNKVVGSLFAYKKDNSYPFTPRVDYTELYTIINKKYGTSIDIDSIGGFRR